MCWATKKSKIYSLFICVIPLLTIITVIDKSLNLTFDTHEQGQSNASWSPHLHTVPLFVSRMDAGANLVQSDSYNPFYIVVLLKLLFSSLTHLPTPFVLMLLLHFFVMIFSILYILFSIQSWKVHNQQLHWEHLSQFALVVIGPYTLLRYICADIIKANISQAFFVV